MVSQKGNKEKSKPIKRKNKKQTNDDYDDKYDEDYRHGFTRFWVFGYAVAIASIVSAATSSE